MNEKEKMTEIEKPMNSEEKWTMYYQKTLASCNMETFMKRYCRNEGKMVAYGVAENMAEELNWRMTGEMKI